MDLKEAKIEKLAKPKMINGYPYYITEEAMLKVYNKMDDVKQIEKKRICLSLGQLSLTIKRSKEIPGFEKALIEEVNKHLRAKNNQSLNFLDYANTMQNALQFCKPNEKLEIKLEEETKIEDKKIEDRKLLGMKKFKDNLFKTKEGNEAIDLGSNKLFLDLKNKVMQLEKKVLEYDAFFASLGDDKAKEDEAKDKEDNAENNDNKVEEIPKDEKTENSLNSKDNQLLF